MNKIGIHFAYWGSSWDIDLIERINYAADCGFDVIDITPPSYMLELDYEQMKEVKKCAADRDIELSFCIGFPKEKDMASENKMVREAGIDYTKRMIEAVHFMGGRVLSGILYSRWPYLYDSPLTEDDKKRAWENALHSVRVVAPIAHDYGIEYVIELVNRFEQYILNSVDEGLKFCEELKLPYVGLLVDTFHANIEENNIGESIRKAGDRLRHMHISENNRTLPGMGKHINWQEIFGALKNINYQGHIVMEPFVQGFGSVGNDLRIWRNLVEDVSKKNLDLLAKSSIQFVKKYLD